MLTIGKLKQIIEESGLSDAHVITNEQNQQFIHVLSSDMIILSTVKPIGTCNRTGKKVYPSIVEGYTAFCPELDEDLYSFEWTPIDESETKTIKLK